MLKFDRYKFITYIRGIVSLKSNDGMKPKDLKLAESIVEENKMIFEVEWKKFFKGGDK